MHSPSTHSHPLSSGRTPFETPYGRHSRPGSHRLATPAAHLFKPWFHLQRKLIVGATNLRRDSLRSVGLGQNARLREDPVRQDKPCTI